MNVKDSRVRELFDRALQLRQEDVSVSMQLFERIVSEYETHHFDRVIAGHSCAQLSGLCMHVGDRVGQEHWARRGLGISARFELASLSLFNVLLATGRRREAIEELVRFVELKDSDGYREMFADGILDNLSPDEEELADRGRALLAWHASKS